MVHEFKIGDRFTLKGIISPGWNGRTARILSEAAPGYWGCLIEGGPVEGWHQGSYFNMAKDDIHLFADPLVEDTPFQQRVREWLNTKSATG